MESKDNKTEEVKPSTNLDSLLDDALEDFSKPTLPKKEKTSQDDSPGNANVWTDEFIAATTQNFEATMRSILSQQQQSQTQEANDTSDNNQEPPLDLGAMSAEFSRFAEAAAKAATESSTDNDFTKCLADTMQQLAKNKEDAKAAPSAEDLSKIFEGFGLGGNTGEADGSEFGGLFPIMQTMLENILSKDVLYPPLKEIVTKFPDWLADNRKSLSEEDYNRYNKQYDIMKQVVEKFEGESEDDSDQVKAQNSESILLLMQKLQELGQPPKDLVGDFEPILSVDEGGNPQLPDLSSLLGGMGFPSLGTDMSSTQQQPPEDSSNSSKMKEAPGNESNSTGQPGGGEEQCTVM